MNSKLSECEINLQQQPANIMKIYMDEMANRGNLLQKLQTAIPCWNWTDCHLPIITPKVSGTQWWSLRPTHSINLTNPVTKVQTVLDVDIKIETLPRFNYDKEHRRWSWHKSWIMPTITVQTVVTSPNKITPDVTQLINKSELRVLVVRPATRNTDKFHLIDLGVQGLAQKPVFLNEIVTFQGLKFSTTSYKNQEHKLSIAVALVYLPTLHSHPHVLCSKISPPIFVDSRRNSRVQQSAEKQKVPRLIEDVLNKKLCKRTKDHIQEISDSVEGLFNYLTAPNIRDKAKDPFFLAYRFGSATKLYFNNTLAQKSQLVKQFAQLQIEKELWTKRNRINKRQFLKYSQCCESALITLVFGGLDESYTFQKLFGLICCYSNEVLSLANSQKALSPHFQLISNPQQLQMLYKQYIQCKVKTHYAKQFYPPSNKHLDSRQHCLFRPIIKQQPPQPALRQASVKPKLQSTGDYPSISANVPLVQANTNHNLWCPEYGVGQNPFFYQRLMTLGNNGQYRPY